MYSCRFIDVTEVGEKNPANIQLWCDERLDKTEERITNNEANKIMKKN